MGDRQSEPRRLLDVIDLRYAGQIRLRGSRICPPLLPGLLVAALFLAAVGPQTVGARGVGPGYFKVKLHDPLPLQEIADSSAEYERVIDAQAFFEAPSVSQAGAHADLTVSTVFNVEGLETLFNETDVPANTVIHLPAGLAANFGSIPACKFSAFRSTVYDNETPHCTAASQLGVVSALFGGQLRDRSYPLYKINRQDLYGTHGDHLAAIGFPYEFIRDRVPVILRMELRTDSDYGMTLSAYGRLPEFVPAPFITFWGVPWAPTHDSERWDPESQHWGASVESLPVPFISNASDCTSGVLEGRLKVQYRFEPDHWLPDDPEDFAYRAFLPEPTDCESMDFRPRVGISSTTRDPDSSTGLIVDVDVPRSVKADGRETPSLKEITLAFPTGLSVNPATLNGMAGCTPDQIGLSGSKDSGPVPIRFELGEAHCPDASKIGNGTVDTPLIEEQVKASIYVATPYQNPFNSLIALYVVLDSQAFTSKLAVKVDVDRETGRLTAKMTSLPQLPFERIHLRLFDGPRAALATPEACGESAADVTLSPWSTPQSGPPAQVHDRWTFNTADGGGPCAGEPGFSSFSPILSAGSRDAVAGQYSSFIVRLERLYRDSSVRAVEMKLPRGLAADLRDVSYCGDADIARAEERRRPGGGALEVKEPSCPRNAEIGSAVVGVGTGSIPLFVRGTVYLAGPYSGGPLSLVVITPAIGGGDKEDPLVDLGAIVVRVALRIDPRSGFITASSDSIPQVVDGIPLRLNDLRLQIDRPDFVRNPTSCDEMKVVAGIESATGAVASPANRFQLGGCRGLAFQPNLKVRMVKDQGRRSSRLRAVVTASPGEAGLSRVSLLFPKSAVRVKIPASDICREMPIAKDSCPSRSIFGRAVVWSPLLLKPLRGPIYVASRKGRRRLVFALDGEVSLSSVGRVGMRRGRLRIVIGGLPDLPLSKVKISLRGKSRGIATSGSSRCAGRRFVLARFTAHSGNVRNRRTPLGGVCVSRARSHKRSGHR